MKKANKFRRERGGPAMLDPSEAFSTGMTDAGYWNGTVGRATVLNCPISGVKDERDAVPARAQVALYMAEVIQAYLNSEAKLPPDQERTLTNAFQELVRLSQPPPSSSSSSSSSSSLGTEMVPALSEGYSRRPGQASAVADHCLG